VCCFGRPGDSGRRLSPDPSPDTTSFSDIIRQATWRRRGYPLGGEVAGESEDGVATSGLIPARVWDMPPKRIALAKPYGPDMVFEAPAE